MHFEEEWDLTDLGEEIMHNLYKTDNAQGSELAYVLGLAKTEADNFIEEQSRRTDLGQANAREQMKKIMCFTRWMTKTKPQCISCQAEAGGIPVDEARRDHMASRSSKEIQRGSAWKETVERREVNWHLMDLEKYRTYARKRKGSPRVNLRSPTRTAQRIPRGT